MQEDFGWLLVHATWQTGIVALVLRLLLSRLTSAQERYRACWSAIALSIALAALTWQQDLFRSVVVLDSPAVGGTRSTGLPDGIAMLFWVWLAVIIPGLMRLVIAGVYRRLRRGAPATTWQKMADGIAMDLGLRPVPVVRLPSDDGPLTFGVIRPVVCIPESLEEQMSESQRRFILAHELAHVKRADALALVLQRVVEVVFVFQPAVRWITRRLHTEREYCCDDVAVEYCGDALGYARALAVLERLRARPVQFSAVLGSGGGQLRERVSRIAERTTPSVGGSVWALAGVGALTLCAAMLVQAQPDRYIDGLSSPPSVKAVVAAPRPASRVRVRAMVEASRPVAKEYVAPQGWMSQRPVEWADEVDALPEADVLAQMTPPQAPPATPVQIPEPPAPPAPPTPLAPLEPVRVVLPRSMAERIAEVVMERRMGRGFKIGLRLRLRREVERSVIRSLFAPRRPLVICVKRCGPETI